MPPGIVGCCCARNRGRPAECRGERQCRTRQGPVRVSCGFSSVTLPGDGRGAISIAPRPPPGPSAGRRGGAKHLRERLEMVVESFALSGRKSLLEPRGCGRRRRPPGAGPSCTSSGGRRRPHSRRPAGPARPGSPLRAVAPARAAAPRTRSTGPYARRSHPTRRRPARPRPARSSAEIECRRASCSSRLSARRAAAGPGGVMADGAAEGTTSPEPAGGDPDQHRDFVRLRNLISARHHQQESVEARRTRHEREERALLLRLNGRWTADLQPACRLAVGWYAPRSIEGHAVTDEADLIISGVRPDLARPSRLPLIRRQHCSLRARPTSAGAGR